MLDAPLPTRKEIMVGKTKDGIIYFYVRYKDASGKVKQKKQMSKAWKTKKEAKEAEDKFLESVKVIGTNITVGELYQLYLKDHGSSMKLKSLYTQDNTYSNYIKPYFEKRVVDKITKQDIMIWQRQLADSTFSKTKFKKELLSNGYIAKIQEYLKTILIFGEKYDYIERNPFTIRIYQRKEEVKKEMLYWTAEEFNRFILEIDDIVFEAFFRVLYGCGLREGEAMALTIGDVNLKDGMITVNKTYDSIHRICTTPKTKNSYRSVQMTDKVKTSVQKLIDHYRLAEGFSDDRILFGYCVHLAPKTIKNRQVAACKKAKVKVIRIHDFRHSHVSLLVNMGFNAFDIAKRLGHTVEMVNEVYSHWFTESQTTMVNALNEYDRKMDEKLRPKN